jgi:hypothetical protein
MNINAITAILLELTYQNSNVTAPTTRTEGVAKVRDVTAAAKEALAAEGVSASRLQSAPAETLQKAEQPFSIPAFIPLPLRTELFQEARFFARLGEDKTNTGAARETEEIFICLITENLGRIWVGVSCRNDFLSIKCFTDREDSNKILRQNFSPLREDLKTIGFKEVSLSSQARAELGSVVEGLLPKFEEHLFDRKI